MTEHKLLDAKDSFAALRKDAEVRLNAVTNEIKALGCALISELSNPFFERHPNVHGIRWHQLNPRHGEDRSFRVSAPQLEIIQQDSREREGHQDLLRNKQYFLEEIERAKAFMDVKEVVAGHQRLYRMYTQKDLDRFEDEIASIDAVIAHVGGIEAYERIVADFKDLSIAIRRIDQFDLKLIFGNPALVFVTRSGTEVRDHY
jgi:hypothetical protein